LTCGWCPKPTESLFLQEARYCEYVWSKVSMVYDIDHTQNQPYGEFYNQRNPLTLEAIQKKESGI